MNESTRRSRLVAAIMIAGIFLVVLVATPWVVIKYFLNGDANKTVIVEVANKPVAAAAAPAPTPVPGAPARTVAVPGAPAAAANGSNIGGVVQNEQGIPVAAVRVNVNWPTGTEQMQIWKGARTTSDAGGHWTITGPPKDSLSRLQINVTSRDYVNGAVAVATPDSLLAHTAVIALSRGMNLMGTVSDAQGQPVAGATIRAGDEYGNYARTTRSSAAGKFTLRHLKPGETTILTTAAGHTPDLRKLAASAASAPLAITLKTSSPLHGRVVDSGGRPIAGVTIYIGNWRNTGILQWRGTTDAQGQFTMPDPPDDAIGMGFQKQGYQSVYQDNLTRATAAVITLHGMLHVSGTVVDAETGKLVPSFSIIQGIEWNSQQPPTWQPQWNVPKMTTPGRFDFDEDQNYAGYAVRIEAPGYYTTDSRVFTADEKQVKLELKMKPGKDLLVRALDPDGTPAGGATGLLAKPGQWAYIRDGAELQNQSNDHATADGHGQLRFPPQTGVFKLAVFDGKGYAEIDSAKLIDSTPVRLVAWGHIEGRLMIGANPGANQQIFVQTNFNQVYTPNAIMISNQITPTTDAEGNFVAERVRPGQASVSRVIAHAAPGGGEYWDSTQTQWITLAAGQTVHVTLGGKGRAVVGKVELPPELASRHDWSYSEPCQAMSIDPAAVSTDAKSAVKSWLNDALGRTPPPKPPATIPFAVKDDRTFRIDDVPAGTYQISVNIAAGQFGMPAIASGSITFTIPPMPSGRSDEALELPPVQLIMTGQ
jgi:protocatechuate 3,4-dioxygenase beta subunit